MTTPQPPAGDDPPRRWQDQDTEQFARPDVDDDYSAESRGGYSGAGASGAYYVVEEPLPLTEEELAGLRGPAGPPLLSTRRVVPLEVEPSSVVQRYLFPTEKFRGEWKRHWIQHRSASTTSSSASTTWSPRRARKPRRRCGTGSRSP